ncbi:MAG: filamentous hemagglutinin N-terminal domain-containing protein, partial [Pseudomonadota bacterium]
MPLAQAEPTGGQISTGAGAITQVGTTTTITQNTQNLAINWQNFSIGSNEAVRFNQPNATSIALNRVLGQDPSTILGSLSANGQVFVLNPNGVLFGAGSQVNVGGLVASSLSLSDADFMAGKYTFGNDGTVGAVVNQGALTAAQGGYIALLAPEVRNEGVITATLGTALLGAGDKVTLNLNNGSLLSYTTDQGSLNALAENRQLIQADGGQVYMSAKAADALSTAVVNNTGIIEARTMQNVGGVIKLMGDMQVGTVNVGGTLDASAPNGGNGGFIETSAAHVKIADGTQVTTSAAQGLAGNWLIDPFDFTIAASGGDITGALLSSSLAGGNVQILSSAGTVGGTLGDINVNDAVTWTANTTLTLSAFHDVNVNQLIDANVGATGAGSVVLRADNTGTGPGAAAGTVNFSGTGAVALNTGTANIYYNPISYATPNNYTGNVTGGTLNSYMLVFVDNTSATANNKTYDGNTAATLNTPFTFLTGPDGVSAGQLVSLSLGTATFNSKDVLTATTVSFSGYGLAGADAGMYSLFGQPTSQTASITPLALTGAAIGAASSTYGSALTPGAVSFGNIVIGDTVTGAATVNTGATSTSGNFVVGNYTQTAGTTLGGTDAGNYSFAGFTSAANYTINPLALTGTITGGGNTYGSALVAGT